MTYKITAPKKLQANITLPASKSISNRALVIHALTGGSLRPENLSDCDDTSVVINALENNPEVIDIKAAGTAMRFMTAYLSVTPGTHTITGTERMKHRPIGTLVEALKQLGAEIRYENEEGFPPLRITGHHLFGGRVDVPGNVSSQFISALLMMGPVMRNGLELHLIGSIVSRSYIDMTLSIMKHYGASVEWTDVDTITVDPKPYEERNFQIENDWSASSYWYEMLALQADRESYVVLPGLMDGSSQGDSAVKYIFSLLGVKTTFAPAGDRQPTTVTLSRRLMRAPKLDCDFVNCPDLVQTVVTTCCAMNIPFHFTGLASLKIKETDRIEALKAELLKLGYVIKSHNDSELIWDGSRCEASFEPIDTYEDHRMAMAFAPMAIVLPGIRINNPEVVSKSYPRFWDDLRKAGFQIEEV